MHLSYRISSQMSELHNEDFLFFKIFSYFRFLILKFPSYEKLVMTAQFGLARFYDVIIRNSVFKLKCHVCWWHIFIYSRRKHRRTNSTNIPGELIQQINEELKSVSIFIDIDQTKWIKISYKLSRTIHDDIILRKRNSH